MAYGNAIGAVTPEGAPVAAKAIKGGIKGGFKAAATAKATAPSTAGALIGGLINGPSGAAYGASIGAAPAILEGIYTGARAELFPPPPEAVPSTPFRPNPAVARRMPFGGPGPDAFNPPGANIPRGRYTPPEPTAPKAPDPFKPNPATARKMPFGGPAPDPFSSGKPVGPTGWEAPTEPLYPAPSEPPPAEPFQRFQVKQGVKDRMRGGARGGMTPGERGGHVPARRTSGPRQLPPPPKAAVEGATEADGVILTPAMKEALVQAELAKRGLPSKMTPMPKGSPGEAPPPGSTVLPPKTNLPPHYGGLRARVGDVGTDTAYAKDLKVATRLKSQGITPEQWEAMDTATRNAHVKAADPKFREYKEGPQKGFGRSAEEGFGHITETLRGLYR
jgi:hypothetical protein